MFPTPVGMNRKKSKSGSSSTGVPHTRGDEPACRDWCLVVNKRVFGLVIDFGTSQSPKSTR
ncbi:hypothetical protein, partial [Thiolapillus sp.]|uniref:hypothetical protein n=1 Tax=Thiolapillus sp. TaxID=2017437 RepID=UPI003AF4EF61